MDLYYNYQKSTKRHEALYKSKFILTVIFLNAIIYVE